jgi:eukaryotic-like serine/threonine-protein kinase
MGVKITAEEWATVSRLLGEVLELPESARAAWLDALAEPDASFRQLLRELLASDTKPGFLNTLPWLDASAASQGGPEPGSTLGPYRLVRELGHGGMGTVWLAERADGTLKRPAALKLPHPGLHNRHFLERFDRERDILAALSHPNIATLYDAGVAAGQPFLALEYVEGVPITDHCDRSLPAVRERLFLFLQVMRAVEYAHSHLVIHRDLKPSNILVTAEGQVKLLDFGIAKLLGEEAGAETELTQVGGRMMTPDYASPEQVRGQPVSTASDVYALGTVLYELLAGEHPWKLRHGSRSALEEAILNLDPCRPSETARASRKLAATLRGDLDSIVLKALKKQPAERYATVNSFAQDIERYLAGDPVSAQPDSAWYVARKFLSRHKLAAMSSAATVLALAAGLSVALWQAHIARTQTRTAAAVERFLEDIFRANSSDQPDPVKARQTTARELLDIGARKIDGELAAVPEAKLQVLDTLSSMYRDLGLDDQAVAVQRKSVSLARTLYGNTSLRLAVALMRLAGALHASQSVGEREAVLLEAKRILDRNGDFTSQDRGLLLWNLAQHYQSSDMNKALEYSREGVNVLRAYPPSADLDEALFEYALVCVLRGDEHDAEPLLGEAIQVSKKAVGDPNPDLPRLYAYQGEARQKLLEFGPAEDSFRQALTAARKINGEDHVDTLETELRLGQFLCLSSRTKEGLRLLEHAKDIALRTKGAADPFYTPQTALEYGFALARSGRLEEGLGYISQAVDNRRKNRPGTHYLAQMLESQARVLLDLSREAEARKLLNEAVAIDEKVHAPASYIQIEDSARLAIAAGHPAEAAAAIETYRAGRTPSGVLSLDSLNIHVLKAEAALARGDAEAAIRLAAEARAELDATAARQWLKRTEARAALAEGRGDLMQHRAPGALPLLRRALDLRSEILDANSPELAEAQVALAACYLDLGERAQAAALRDHARAIHASHPQLARGYREPLEQLARRMR